MNKLSKERRNQLIADKLDNMKGLSDKALLVISGTDISAMEEIFGGMNTAEEVNAYVEEYYSDDDM